MKNNIIFFLSVIFFLGACKTQQGITEEPVKTLDAVNVIGKKLPYQGSTTRTFDLLHTKLDVRFSWEKQHLFGDATLTLKPYFFATNILELDAKGMEIKEISLLKDSNKVKLNYTYDLKVLTITLDKIYDRNEKFDIFIKYVSKPNDLEKTEGLSAISEDKGLYFINPLGKEKDKPKQIWTQGEPESNSVWFPTIDHPNERCTEEISMTIENNYTAISNGYIAGDVDNGDGTYTITWKQDKPIAPYLFMMAIGEYAEIRDSWRAMSVNYYVEKEYAPVAQRIFGNTPEMLEFFSNKLGVEYPWDKYWQIVVRDYVSGAMENTTSVIFGEFVQRDARELLDEDHEDIVAHELFHHWFGDLVTCESWANLPLNESFATYGEVLWDEYKYGNNAKYLKIKQDMDAYFREAKSGKQVQLIRYNHDTAEDMFDRHSYQKGGVVLNMLREVVGDDAFFTSLQNYLWFNKYQSVEIHNLRMSFEETTGQDLNWFFDQWFLSAGHPIIDVNYTYSDSSVIVNLKQEPSKEDYLVYRLPMVIEITEGSKTRRENVVFDKKTQSFEFFTRIKPSLVNVDANKVLLAEFNDNKTEENYIVQFNTAKNLMDKIQALEYFSTLETKSPAVKKVISNALSDKYWFVQETAMSLIDGENIDGKDLSKIANLAQKGEKTSVQSKAYFLIADAKSQSTLGIVEKGIQSKSYRVNAAALDAMLALNPKRALTIAEGWENVDNYDIIDEVGYVYSQEGDTTKKDYYKNLITNSEKEYSKYYGVYHYSKYLGKMDEKTVLDGVSFIEEWGKTDDSKFANQVAKSALIRVSNQYVIKADSYKAEIGNTSGMSSGQIVALENEYANTLLIIDRINEATTNLNVEE